MPDQDAGAVLRIDLQGGVGVYADPSMPKPDPNDTILYGIKVLFHQEIEYRGKRYRQHGYSFVTGQEFH